MEILSGTAGNLPSILIVEAELHRTVFFLNPLLVPVKGIFKAQEAPFHFETVLRKEVGSKVDAHTLYFRISGIFHRCLEAALKIQVAPNGQRFSVEAKINFQIDLGGNFRIYRRSVVRELINLVDGGFPLQRIEAYAHAHLHVIILNHRNRAGDVNLDGDLQSSYTGYLIAADVDFNAVTGDFSQFTGQLVGHFHICIHPDRGRRSGLLNVRVIADLGIFQFCLNGQRHTITQIQFSGILGNIDTH